MKQDEQSGLDLGVFLLPCGRLGPARLYVHPGDSEAGTGSQQAELSLTHVPRGQECLGYLQRAACHSSRQQLRRFFSGIYCRDLTTPRGQCHDPEGPIGLGPLGAPAARLVHPRSPASAGPFQPSLPHGPPRWCLLGRPRPRWPPATLGPRSDSRPPLSHGSEGSCQISSLFSCPLVIRLGGGTQAS